MSALQAWVSRGRRFEAGGVASHVWDEGTGSEPVVCLHGVPASSFAYRKLLVELSHRGLRGVAFDFPGLGLAGRPPGFDYSWSGLAQWTVSAWDTLGLDRFHLVVHDIGGPVGIAAAGVVPDRIASLTVLNSFLRVSTHRRPWMMELFARRGIGEAWLAGSNQLTMGVMLRHVGLGPGVSRGELAVYPALLKRGDRGKAFLQIMRGFEQNQRFEARLMSALAALDCPTQVIWGREDPVLPARTYGRECAAAVGAGELQLVPGKHFVQEDAPVELSVRIAELTRR